MTLIHQHLIGLCVRLKRLLHIVYLFLLTGVLRSQVYRSKHTPVELADAPAAYLKRQKKPEWVTRKIIYLKAMMPSQGCRKISEVFNRLHGEKDFMTVSKSYVYTVFHILESILRYGKPRKIRSDNEAIFTARRFRWTLALLGIRHQRTEVACPWMNGRIERFFNTLKQHTRRIVIKANELDQRLREFRFFYNHLRTHSHLQGRTPAEQWEKGSSSRSAVFVPVSLWQGVLCGYYRLK